MTGFSGELAEELRPYQEILQVKWPAAVHSRDSFVQYLIQTYHYVVASVPLMELAAASPDVVNDAACRRYLARHIEQEQGHDAWLLEDLAILGISRQSVIDTPPLLPTVQMVGLAYYTILHQHPLGLLGYIYALESGPATRSALDALMARCRVPAESMRTILEHGAVDRNHRRELATLLDRYALHRRAWLIRRTAVCTLRALLDLFCSLHEQPGPASSLAAAP